MIDQLTRAKPNGTVNKLHFGTVCGSLLNFLAINRLQTLTDYEYEHWDNED